jgi:hypothetical protein
MIEIPLSNGGIAVVDDQDAHLARFRWYRSAFGYVVRKDGPDVVWLHREILGLMGNDREIDHKDRNKLDNRRSNLRVATHAENCQNVPAQTGTSQFRGVHWCPRTKFWRARVMLSYRSYCLGRYGSELDAARAAEAFRREHMPFAVHDMSLDPIPKCCCRMCQLSDGGGQP